MTTAKTMINEEYTDREQPFAVANDQKVGNARFMRRNESKSQFFSKRRKTFDNVRNDANVCLKYEESDKKT